ncbi:hypothetical protein PSDI105340_19250 [Pseudoalteromonas distincta]
MQSIIYRNHLEMQSAASHWGLYQSAYIWGLFNVKKITLELGKNFCI